MKRATPMTRRSARMHSVVVSPFFDWGNDHPPAHEYHDTVIYEAHVKGLTMLHPDIDDDIRGTYVAMGEPAIIEHLTELGVTAIELMPVHQFVQDGHLGREGDTQLLGLQHHRLLRPAQRVRPRRRYRAAGPGVQADGEEPP